MYRRYDDLLHRTAAEGLGGTGSRDDLADLCADAVHGGVSTTLIGVLCDDAAPAVARERALALVVGHLRDVPASAAPEVERTPAAVASGHAALV